MIDDECSFRKGNAMQISSGYEQCKLRLTCAVTHVLCMIARKCYTQPHSHTLSSYVRTGVRTSYVDHETE